MTRAYQDLLYTFGHIIGEFSPTDVCIGGLHFYGMKHHALKCSIASRAVGLAKMKLSALIEQSLEESRLVWIDKLSCFAGNSKAAWYA